MVSPLSTRSRCRRLHLSGGASRFRAGALGQWSEKKAPEGRWRSCGYEELLQRDKVSLDIFWLEDESLEDSANLPAPEVIAGEIVDDLRAALEQFEAIQTDLSRKGGASRD